MNQLFMTVITSVIVALVTIVFQKSVSNLFTGIAVWVSRPFKKGDKICVKYNSYEVASGHVMSVGFNYTKIKAYNRDVYLIPNTVLESCTIINSDYKSGVNHIDSIRISLDSTISKALSIIQETLISSEDTDNTNDNTNIVVKYDDGGITIQYNVRTKDVDSSYKVCSDICVHLLNVFNSTKGITVI